MPSKEDFTRGVTAAPESPIIELLLTFLLPFRSGEVSTGTKVLLVLLLLSVVAQFCMVANNEFWVPLNLSRVRRPFGIESLSQVSL